MRPRPVQVVRTDQTDSPDAESPGATVCVHCARVQALVQDTKFDMYKCMAHETTCIGSAQS